MGLNRYRNKPFTQVALAKQYNISQYAVWSLVNGKQWPFINAVTIRKEYNGNLAKHIS